MLRPLRRLPFAGVEITRKHAKAVTACSLSAWAAMVYQQVDDFEFTLPIRPVLHAEPAYSGGTIAIGSRGFASSPPDAPIEIHNRRTYGGSA